MTAEPELGRLEIYVTQNIGLKIPFQSRFSIHLFFPMNKQEAHRPHRSPEKPIQINTYEYIILSCKIVDSDWLRDI